MSHSFLRECEGAALRILALRDHSSHELAQKLRQRFECDTESLALLFERLQALGYLDDLRFAQAFIRASIARGRGLQRIKHDLQTKGVEQALIEQALTEADVDWLQLASAQRIKKFGKLLPTDFKERARQSRFLAGRGFSTDTIRAVFQYHPDDDWVG